MSKIELSFVCEELNLDEATLTRWIELRLIEPADESGPYFDEEDFARLCLMRDLKHIYEVNDPSLEVILHLVDQIHHLTTELKKIKTSEDK
jgi:chaperone modulatory protein CbpM